MVGNPKWEPGDDHIRESFPRYIDASPKTVRPKQDAVRGLFKLLEHAAAGRTLTLDHECVSTVQLCLHALSQALHAFVAGEEDKGATVGLLQKVRNPFFESILIFGIARVRHFFDYVNTHLLFVVERAADLSGLDIVSTDSAPEIGQVVAPDGERRTGHDTDVLVRK